MVQARMRMARNARHTIDFDFNDTGRRFRNFDEHASNNNGSSGNNQMQDEEANAAVRSDSPVIARLGPAVNSSSASGSGSGTPISDTLEGTLNSSGSNSRRRCGKTSVDLRHQVHNPRFQLPEQQQLDECPSSGDEGVVSPRKRIKMDYHHHHHSNASAVSLSNNSIPSNIQIIQ